MTGRLVSPDRRLFLMRDDADLDALAELYSLTKSHKGNIKQLLGWKNVGNGRGDRNLRGTDTAARCKGTGIGSVVTGRPSCGSGWRIEVTVGPYWLLAPNG